jgi:hypothetical protein
VHMHWAALHQECDVPIFFVPFQIYKCTEHTWEAYQSNLLQPLYCYNPQYIWAQNRLLCFAITLSGIHNFIWMKGVKHSYILLQHFIVINELLVTVYISPGKNSLTQAAYLCFAPYCNTGIGLPFMKKQEVMQDWCTSYQYKLSNLHSNMV